MDKIKTVINAVNEFKGVWPYLDQPAIIHGNTGQGWSHFYTESTCDLSDRWQFVCTKAEFNQCVKELSAAEWMSKPKYIIGNTYEFKDDGNNDVDWEVGVLNNIRPDCYQSKCDNKTEWFDSIREVIKPAYTQAMYDAGELPLVGMECLISDLVIDNGGYYSSTILFLGKSCIVWSHMRSEYSQSIDSVSFKPLTPPIRLEDGKAYQFDCGRSSWCGIYSDTNKRFYSHVNDKGLEFCTNIKLLGVIDG